MDAVLQLPAVRYQGAWDYRISTCTPSRGPVGDRGHQRGELAHLSWPLVLLSHIIFNIGHRDAEAKSTAPFLVKKLKSSVVSRLQLQA